MYYLHIIQANSEMSKVTLKTVHYLSGMYFCWGMASSMIFSLLPVFIIEELHSNYGQFGLLEGTVMFCAFITKLFAGFLIDIFKRKINILYTGTISTVISKMLFALANSVLFVFIAKSIDRIAKGLRSAPVDAIFAELNDQKGYMYSLRYSANIFGSIIGALITSSIVQRFGHEFRLIFTLACIPTLLALYILCKKVKYRDNVQQFKTRPNWKLVHLKHFSKEYWKFLILVALIMLHCFSEGFITLRARNVLNSLSELPMYTAIYEICIICVSIPMGKLSDKINSYMIILFGVIISIIGDIIGILATNRLQIIVFYIMCGTYIGTTHSILSSTIAKLAPKELIGTSFALYYGVSAVMLFISNQIAGSIGSLLTNTSSSTGPFIYGSCINFITLCYLIYLIRKSS